MLKKVMDSSIRKRLIISFIIVLVVCSSASIPGIIGLVNSNSQMDRLINGPFELNEAVKMLRIEVNVAARTVRDLVLEYDDMEYDTHKDKIYLNIEAARENLKYIEENYSNKVTFDELNTKFEAWTTVVDTIIDNVYKNENATAIRLSRLECAPAIDEIVAIEKKIDLDIKTELAGSVLESEGRTLRVVLIVAHASLTAIKHQASARSCDGVILRIADLVECCQHIADFSIRRTCSQH